VAVRNSDHSAFEDSTKKGKLFILAIYNFMNVPLFSFVRAMLIPLVRYLSINHNMYRDKLPRIYELKDLVKDAQSPDAYFQKFEDTLSINGQKMQKFIELEAALEELDPESWENLKKKATPFLLVRDQRRGWHQLFDTLIEVYGYIYLKNIGCQKISFIPPSETETPDLQGTLGNVFVICEVKRINISDEEIDARRNMTVQDGESENSLSQGFFKKLNSALLKARDQLIKFCSDNNSRRIIYIVINFDNFTGEFDTVYFSQINRFLQKNHISDVEIVFHNQII